MTAPVLRVDPANLRQLAQRCQALSGQIAPALPAVTASAWQATRTATSTVNAVTSTAATAMRGRMTASSGKLTRAAQEYQSMDHEGAVDLAAVPASSAGFTPLVPRSSADGGGGGGGGGW